ncbi:thioredoxin family protein [Flagellimonas oceani]|nr:thioredoxin fold domain-containing protein [Allomuricauda oceani]
MMITSLVAQKRGIDWLSFEQLEDSLSLNPKKVLLFFNADWCAYCKKMEQAAFKDSKVVSLLRSSYYAVKMDVETADTIVFDGQRFINDEIGQKRSPVHQIPKLLASRESIPFSVPAIVILDTEFKVVGRYFEYLSPKKMHGILSK